MSTAPPFLLTPCGVLFALLCSKALWPFSFLDPCGTVPCGTLSIIATGCQWPFFAPDIFPAAYSSHEAWLHVSHLTLWLQFHCLLISVFCSQHEVLYFV